MSIADTIQEIVTKLVYSEVDRAREEAAGAVRRDGGRGLAIHLAVEHIMHEIVRLGIPATPMSLALAFHEAYERLSPQYGYQTREETRTFNPESANGRLMVAVAEEILEKLQGKQLRDEPR